MAITIAMSILSAETRFNMLATATHYEIYLVDIIMPLKESACRIGETLKIRKRLRRLRNTTCSVIQSADLTAS